MTVVDGEVVECNLVVVVVFGVGVEMEDIGLNPLTIDDGGTIEQRKQMIDFFIVSIFVFLFFVSLGGGDDLLYEYGK